MKTLSLLSSCVLVLLSASSVADMFAPSHFCSKPYKPFEFTSEFELESFNDKVERYQRCISDFVDEQNEAIRNHQQAAENAINEWNQYVNYELQ